MAFTPSSVIYLCKVDFDNSYKHVVYFEDKATQQAYFSSRVVRNYENYLTVRKTLPDGGVRSSVKIGENIGALRASLANYMYYQNPNLFGKWMYAFITELIYINENTTEIVFETDVYQTWLFEATLMPSFVIREHSEDDQIGWNLCPEDFKIADYEYETIEVEGFMESWGYLIASTSPHLASMDGMARGTTRSGVYQGLYFYYIESINELNERLDEIEAQKGDAIHSITLIPKFCLGAAGVTSLGGYVAQTNAPAQQTITITLGDISFDGYHPSNNKMFTSPFCNLMVTNNNGEQAEYPFEYFKDYSGEGSKIQFRAVGDISIAPSVMLAPMNYKNVEFMPDHGISLSGFPQCSFNSDAFKLWIAKNEYNLKASGAANAAMIVTGMAAMAAATGGVGLAGVPAIAGSVGAGGAGMMAGSAVAAQGYKGIHSLIGNVYAKSKEPNIMHAGSCSTNLLTAMGENKFSFYIQKIRQDVAIRIDDFFTMYGYQVNRIKIPNRNVRRWYTFTHTADVNIRGGIPNDDMAKLKSIYNKGVTQWSHDAIIGEYTLNNVCLSEV